MKLNSILFMIMFSAMAFGQKPITNDISGQYFYDGICRNYLELRPDSTFTFSTGDVCRRKVAGYISVSGEWWLEKNKLILKSEEGSGEHKTMFDYATWNIKEGKLFNPKEHIRIGQKIKYYQKTKFMGEFN